MTVHASTDNQQRVKNTKYTNRLGLTHQKLTRGMDRLFLDPIKVSLDRKLNIIDSEKGTNFKIIHINFQ